MLMLIMPIMETRIESKLEMLIIHCSSSSLDRNEEAWGVGSERFYGPSKNLLHRNILHVLLCTSRDKRRWVK